MKKAALLLLLAIPTITFGQNKIEGIGNFKLRKTEISYLDIFAKENKLKRLETWSFRDFMGYERATDKIVELMPDTTKSYSMLPHSRYCKLARVFFIPKMEISGIELTKTYLTFYNDTLVAILTDYKTPVLEAIKFKYGEPEMDIKEKETECSLRSSGSSADYMDTMYYQKWTNDDINCIAAIGRYRDRNCEQQILSYISLTFDDAVSQLAGCDIEEKKALKKRQDARKKDQLEDF